MPSLNISPTSLDCFASSLSADVTGASWVAVAVGGVNWQDGRGLIDHSPQTG